MIRLSEQWAIEEGSRQFDFCLVQFKEGKTRDGQSKISETRTYHPNLKQIAHKIATVNAIAACKECESVDQMIEAMEKVEKSITENVKLSGV